MSYRVVVLSIEVCSTGALSDLAVQQPPRNFTRVVTDRSRANLQVWNNPTPGPPADRLWMDAKQVGQFTAPHESAVQIKRIQNFCLSSLMLEEAPIVQAEFDGRNPYCLLCIACCVRGSDNDVTLLWPSRSLRYHPLISKYSVFRYHYHNDYHYQISVRYRLSRTVYDC
jgi:hypothetical protein